jgi:trans-aconitate methyltransferase
MERMPPLPAVLPGQQARLRPTTATLALAGDVAGRRILDAGCGSGPLFAALRDRGAIVTGFDKSAGMLELARRRLGDGADLRVADLAVRCRSPTARSMTSSRPWCCTTWRTGRRRWPSCGAC